MRFRLLGLAVMLGAMFYTTSAFAAGNTEYLNIRSKTQVATLPSTSDLTRQFAGRAGQVVELQGVVRGIFSSGDAHGFFLQIDQNQTLLMSARTLDPDVVVGSQLRVLARIPQHGVMLEPVSVTRATGTALAQADFATLRNASPSTTTDDPFNGVPNPAIQTMPVAQRPALENLPAPEPRRDITAMSMDISGGAGAARNPDIVRLYAERIASYDSGVEGPLAEKIAFHILDKSERYGVDPRLTLSLVAQESRFKPTAVSHAGAQGLGQLMPGTASYLGVKNAFDIEQNLDGTVRYLAQQMDEFGRLSLALAAYNAGPGNVKKYGGVPPFRETQNYVKVIWKDYCRHAGLDPASGQRIAQR